MSTTFLSQPGRPQCLDPTLHSASPMLWIHAPLDSLGVRGPVSLIKSVHSFLSIWTSWTYCYFFQTCSVTVEALGRRLQAVARTIHMHWQIALVLLHHAAGHWRENGRGNQRDNHPDSSGGTLELSGFGKYHFWSCALFSESPILKPTTRPLPP